MGMMTGFGVLLSYVACLQTDTVSQSPHSLHVIVSPILSRLVARFPAHRGAYPKLVLIS